MNEQQKEAFTRETRAIANDIDEVACRKMCTVKDTEALASTIFQKLQCAHKKHYTRYEIKVKPKPNVFRPIDS